MTNLKYLFILGLIFLFGQFTSLKNYTLTKNNAELSFTIPLQVRELEMGNLLYWKASAVEDVRQYNIEKSVDGIDFQHIGTLETTTNNGEEKAYYFFDTELGVSKSYYRLKVKEMDGTTSYSQTILLKKQKKNQFAIVAKSNTMAKKTIDLTLDVKTGGVLEYTLVSYQGELINEESQYLYPGLNEIQIKVETLPEGIYKCKLKFGKEEEILVVQKYGDKEAFNTEKKIAENVILLSVVKNKSINFDLPQGKNLTATPVGIRIIESPKFGIVRLEENQSFRYTPMYNTCENNDVFKYQITVDGETTEASIHIEILCEPLTIIGQMTSSIPLKILGIQNFPNHELMVFNSRGNIVFQRKNYQNDWYGLIGENEFPLNGMYYYVFTDGNNYYNGCLQYENN